MELDDLKIAWKKEVNMTTKITDFDQFQAEVNTLDRKSKYGWLREGSGAAVIIISAIIYVWIVRDTSSLFLQVSTAIFIAPLADAIRRFYKSQQTQTADDWTVLARVKGQIEKRRKEIKMLSTLTTWHVIPIYLAAVLFSYAVYFEITNNTMPSNELMGWWAGFFVYNFIFIRWLNNRAVTKQYQPALDKLETIEAALER
jgi:hypothetical protein